MAQGSSLQPPQTKSGGKDHVISTSEIWQSMRNLSKRGNVPSRKESIRILNEIPKPGGRVAVIGGDLVGCLLADFWSKRGRKVTIVESGKRIGGDMVQILNWILMRNFSQNGVDKFARAQYEEVSDRGVTITTKEGERQTIAADTVVLVDNPIPNRSLVDAVEGKFGEVYAIGDCTEKRMIDGAISDAFNIALKI